MKISRYLRSAVSETLYVVVYFLGYAYGNATVVTDITVEDLAKHPDCMNTSNGLDYRGQRDVTKFGVNCRHWLLGMARDPHDKYHQQFPDCHFRDIWNFCRNPVIPGHEKSCLKSVPWCYDSYGMEHECDIPRCPPPDAPKEKECLNDQKGLDYKGLIDLTVNRIWCQPWTSDIPNNHSCHAAGPGRACRNPSGPGVPSYCTGERPWCYTMSETKRWEYCDIPMCPRPLSVRECRSTKQGTEYRGFQTRTRSGRLCQGWDRQTPHVHECGRTMRGSFCRNPDRTPWEVENCSSSEPWCYTTDPDVRTELCHIPMCDGDDSYTAPSSQMPPSAIGATYYREYGDRRTKTSALRRRIGSSSSSNSCRTIRRVPSGLRMQMKPNGIYSIYTKYTEAYGIPVIGSNAVSNRALKRACYVLRFMLADRLDLRERFYRKFGRVAVIARRDPLRKRNDYDFLPNKYEAAPGLGATMTVPASSARVGNVLCSRYSHTTDDILMRTIAEGIYQLAIRDDIPEFEYQLLANFKAAKARGLWNNTYGSYSPEAYFSEGVQAYFNVNGKADPPDGLHNNITTRMALHYYDDALFRMVQEVFPCSNFYLKRCHSKRHEYMQRLAAGCTAFIFRPAPANYSAYVLQ